MLVLAAATDDDSVRWRGRRHDDDGPGVSQGASIDDLFQAVFHALHDGEQVAVGFRAPLSAARDGTAAADVDAVLAQGEADAPVVRTLGALLTELGRWRPWTVISTSLPRWRATTSVLVWETELPAGADDAALDAAVEGFYALVHNRADRGAETAANPLVNLAAVAARRGELTVDPAQLHEPVVLVTPSPETG